MNTIQDMIDKLNSFESPDAIADFFSEVGVKGDRADTESCVITNWFLSETNATGCSTSCALIIVDEEFTSWTMVPNEAVSEFIESFDDGYYPELVTPCNCEECIGY